MKKTKLLLLSLLCGTIAIAGLTACGSVDFSSNTEDTSISTGFSDTNSSDTDSSDSGSDSMKETYTIMLPEELTGGAVTAEENTVEEGGDIVLTITSDKGYTLEWLKVNGEEVAVTGNTYTIKDVSENVEVTAQFKINVYTVMIADDIAYGRVTADKLAAEHGTDVVLTVTADEGYSLDELTVNGAAVIVADGTYTIEDVDGNVTINARFKANNDTAYTVRHYMMDAEGEYSVQPEVEIRKGRTDASVTLAELAKEELIGFTFAEAKIDGETATTAKIAGDGSLIVELYYTRDQCEITFEAVAEGAYTEKKQNSNSLWSVTANGEALDFGDMVYFGTEITVSFDGEGYTLNELKINDQPTELIDGEYTFTAEDNAYIRFDFIWNGDKEIDGLVLSDFDEDGYRYTVSGRDMLGAEVATTDGILKVTVNGSGGPNSYFNLKFANPVLKEDIASLYFVVRGENIPAPAGRSEVYIGGYDGAEGFKPGYYVGKELGDASGTAGTWMTLAFTAADIEHWETDEDGYLTSVTIMFNDTLNGNQSTFYIDEVRYIPVAKVFEDTDIADGLLSDFNEEDYKYSVNWGTALTTAPIIENGVLELEYKNTGNVYVDILFGKPVPFEELAWISFKMRAENLSEVYIAGYDDDVFKGGYYVGTSAIGVNGGLTSEWKEFIVPAGDVKWWEPYADAEGNIYKCRILVQDSQGTGVLYIDEIRYGTATSADFKAWTDTDIAGDKLADFGEAEYAGNVTGRDKMRAAVENGILKVDIIGNEFTYVDIWLGKLAKVEDIINLKIIMKVENLNGEQKAYFGNFDNSEQFVGNIYSDRMLEGEGAIVDADGWATMNFSTDNIAAWGNPDENGCLDKIRIMFSGKTGISTMYIKEISYTRKISETPVEQWMDESLEEGQLVNFSKTEYINNVNGHKDGVKVENGVLDINVVGQGSFSYVNVYMGKLIAVEDIASLKIVMKVEKLSGEQKVYLGNFDNGVFGDHIGQYSPFELVNADEEGWITLELSTENLLTWGNPDENGCLNKIRFMFSDQYGDFNLQIKEISYTAKA